jgi:alginate O-acetyltransferase complex protein AlgI
MTFTSWPFAALVFVVFGAYYTPALRAFQVQLLVLASLFFYGFGQPQLLPLLAIAVLGTYGLLLLSLGNRRVWLPVGIIFNLGLLAFFKYKFLVIDPAQPVLSTIPAIDFLLRLPLPIGISFFVFHNISLLVDISRRERPAPDLNQVLLYIIFFPQLISGPITRAENFLPQIKPKSLGDVAFVEAAKWIVTGYFFKLYVANNLNEMTGYMAFPYYELVRSGDRWLLVILYSYQIYADFFGYSAIALGLGLLFGYRLPLNFNLPYISQSFAEFWTRWHMSLSNWLRTYLYIPLGGNRHGSTRTKINLMIVMGLGGLWHGAGLSYLMWGAMHGVLLVAERQFLHLKQTSWRDLPWLVSTIRTLRMGLVFLCVSLLWIFFKLPDFHHATDYLAGMFADHASPNPVKFFNSLVLMYALPVIVQHFGSNWLAGPAGKAIEPFVYGIMIALMIVEAGPDSSFIYFQF